MKTKVDNRWYSAMNKYKWHYGNGYAYRQEKRKTIYLHRTICTCGDGLEIDHINMDKLDNTSSNLRVVNRSQNSLNKGKYINNTSGYKGVYWVASRNAWQARLKVNYKSYYLGQFNSAIEAHKAYIKFSKKFDFVRTI